MSKKTAPQIEALTHRLSQCPGVFLLPPKTGGTGTIDTGAVVSDLILDIATSFLKPKAYKQFNTNSAKDSNWKKMVQIASWLLRDEFFIGRSELTGRILVLFGDRLRQLATVVKAEDCVYEPARREELVRVCLEVLKINPFGETKTQAADRLQSLDSLERARVMLEAKKAEEHARKVREAMKRKKAKEASAKVMRE